MLQKHSITALLYFFIAALLGILLRLFYVTPISANYKYIVHGHSHIALLGWVYIALTALIYKVYLYKQQSKLYKRIFWCTQITLVGMLVTFPLQGYALFSIIFSTLFLVVSYVFTWFVVKHTLKEHKQKPSYKFITTSLFFMVISSIGPWALGAIMNTLGETSIWYKISIYFYLHFQYNGWFIMALTGLFLAALEMQKVIIKPLYIKRIYWLLTTGIILSFFLSVLWVEPPLFLNVLGGLGGILQLVAFYLLCKLCRAQQLGFEIFSKRLLQFVFVLLVLKMILQLLTAAPYFAKLSFQIIDFVIGYLHLTFLGVVSIMLFVLLDFYKLIRLSKASVAIYITGFVISECLIFYKGLAVWLKLSVLDNYFFILVIISGLIPVALGGLLIKNRIHN
jgi:hypothetical protein